MQLLTPNSKRRLIQLSRSYPAGALYAFLLMLLVRFPFSKWNGRDNERARQCIAQIAPQNEVLNAKIVDLAINFNFKKHIKENDIDMANDKNIKDAWFNVYERMDIADSYDYIREKCRVKEFDWQGNHVGLVTPNSALISEKYLVHVVMGLFTTSILLLLAFAQRLFTYFAGRNRK